MWSDTDNIADVHTAIQIKVISFSSDKALSEFTFPDLKLHQYVTLQDARKLQNETANWESLASFGFYSQIHSWVIKKSVKITIVHVYHCSHEQIHTMSRDSTLQSDNLCKLSFCYWHVNKRQHLESDWRTAVKNALSLCGPAGDTAWPGVTLGQTARQQGHQVLENLKTWPLVLLWTLKQFFYRISAL